MRAGTSVRPKANERSNRHRRGRSTKNHGDTENTERARREVRREGRVGRGVELNRPTLGVGLGLGREETAEDAENAERKVKRRGELAEHSTRIVRSSESCCDRWAGSSTSKCPSSNPPGRGSGLAPGTSLRVEGFRPSRAGASRTWTPRVSISLTRIGSLPPILAVSPRPRVVFDGGKMIARTMG